LTALRGPIAGYLMAGSARAETNYNSVYTVKWARLSCEPVIPFPCADLLARGRDGKQYIFNTV
jgi:hypothetical protein